jgi:RHS repeat-associated protein
MDSTNAYIYGPGSTPIEQVNLSTGTITYLAADPLGSVRGIVSSSGSLVASMSYDAWGNPQTAGGLASYTPFGYSGAYTDPSGLLYLTHRYYDPTSGQFLTVDPLVDQTGAPYSYAADNPVNESDLNGTYPVPNIGPCERTCIAVSVAMFAAYAAPYCATTRWLHDPVAILECAKRTAEVFDLLGACLLACNKFGPPPVPVEPPKPGPKPSPPLPPIFPIPDGPPGKVGFDAPPGCSNYPWVGLT